MLIETTSQEFQALLDEVRTTTIIQCRKELKAEDEWISRDEAMELMRINSRQTFAIAVARSFKSNNKIKAKHLGSKKVIYSKTSILKHLNNE